MEKGNWYTKYFNKNMLNNDNWSKYLQITHKSNNISIKSKIKNIETKYKENLTEIKNTCQNINSIKKYQKLTCLEILQKELEIVNLLSKYSLQNNYLDYEFFLICIQFIFELSEILRKRLKQKKIEHENINVEENIPRCSYKFCKFKDSCIYNYNPKSKNVCYQDHYVHNMVSSDISVLIKYIKSKKTNNKQHLIHNKELLKSINTLTYVIGHMENELKSKCFYSDKSEWDKYHISK